MIGGSETKSWALQDLVGNNEGKADREKPEQHEEIGHAKLRIISDLQKAHTLTCNAVVLIKNISTIYRSTPTWR